MTEQMLEECKIVFNTILKKLDDIKDQNHDLLDVVQATNLIMGTVWESVLVSKKKFGKEARKRKRKDGMGWWARLKASSPKFIRK